MRFLAGTPFHPQWFARTGRKRLIKQLKAAEPHQLVLDIGCFDKWPQKHLPPTCRYFGLDYPLTALNWYGTMPDVYADGSVLPISDRTIDLVLLLDVCEHVPQIQRLFAEIYRVLKPEGRLFLQIPFMYPIHDEPLDFVRLTRYGLQRLAEETDFLVERLDAVGRPCETAALLSNIGFSKTVINWIANRSPALILSFFLPLVIIKNNLLAWLISRFSEDDPFMPFAYQIILRKTGRKSPLRGTGDVLTRDAAETQ